MPPVIHPSQIERSISRLNETAYGLPYNEVADFRRIVSSSTSLADTNTQFKDDAGYDNGSDVASDKWAESVSAGAAFNPDFNFQDIGYFLKDFLGAYAVANSAVPYIHTFTPQSMATSRQMPSRTFLESIGGNPMTVYPSIVGANLTIAGSKMGRLNISAKYEGSGAEIDGTLAPYVSPAVLNDREFGYGSQAFFRFHETATGTNQVITATAVGNASSSGNITVTVTAAGMTTQAVTVAITSGDTPTVYVAKIRTALLKNLVVSNFFSISGSGAATILTPRVRAANDATMNCAIGAGTTGITAAPTATQTTPGVAGVYQAYTCDLETWQLQIDLPPADPGYRQCSPYVVAGDPRSGQVRSEFLVGARKFGFTFTSRLKSDDKMRAWMKAGTVISLGIHVVGIDSKDSSLRITHSQGIIDQAKFTPEINGFVGITGSVDLMSNAGQFPMSAVLMNDVASYAV